jgi:histidinol-phosphate aminotransferase
VTDAFTLPVRDDLVGIASYGAPQLDVPARLNVNENPFSLPPELAQAMGAAVARVATDLNRYPDRDAERLRRALGDYIESESGVHVPASRVWAANGSNEVMHHLFLAFGGPGRLAVTFDPTYSMYPEYARDTFTAYQAFPRNEDFGIDVVEAVDVILSRRPSLVLLTSPNNPTGTALPVGDIRALATAARAAGAMVVVDEAYAEFRHADVPSACTLLAEYPNLVVTRTMSKAFALAGARIGYALVADPAVVDVLKVVRLPYHLSAVTQAVALTALEHAEVLQAQVALLREERDALADWLVAQGLTVAPSDANFVLFGVFDDRDAVWRALLERGVLIRQTGPQGWLRVSVGTPAENDMFRHALLEALGDGRAAAPAPAHDDPADDDQQKGSA